MTWNVALLRIVVVASALLGSACANAPQNAASASGGVRIERIDKEFEFDTNVTRIAIDNPWGEINVRSRDEREVGIHAVIQRMPPDFQKIELKSRIDGDTLQIDVVKAASRNDEAATPGRADVAVYVPADLALSLSTKSGRISARKRQGALQATTDSGEIQASSFSRLNLRSRSGQIRAAAIGKRWQGISEIATDSGRIVLLVPTFGDIALDAETGGKLSTGFGLSVHALAQGGNEAHARYGAGTSQLRARSTKGEIVLEQLVLLGEDKELPEDDD
ncbi:MAG: hypothetical protein ACREPX_07510 [Rhodanobacteraceae bacterium]